MGQIHGDNLGSPVAIVTSKGELTITGSVVTTTDPINILLQDQKNLTKEMLIQLKKLNEYASIIVEHTIEDKDIM